jgi:hypothetical protein
MPFEISCISFLNSTAMQKAENNSSMLTRSINTLEECQLAVQYLHSSSMPIAGRYIVLTIGRVVELKISSTKIKSTGCRGGAGNFETTVHKFALSVC